MLPISEVNYGHTRTPIQFAAMLGHWECVKEIVQNKEPDADDNARYGIVLDLAVENQKIDIVMLLLARGVRSKNAVRLAVGICDIHINMINLLLSFNSDITKRDWCDSYTPIEYAAEKAYQTSVDAAEYRGMDFYAATLEREKNYWACVEAIAKNRNTDSQDAARYNAALFYAVRAGRISTIMVLLKARAGAIPYCDHNGNSSLHLAARAGDASIVALLLFYGVSPTIRNSIGETPEVVAINSDTHCAFIKGGSMYLNAEASKVMRILFTLLIQAQRQSQTSALGKMSDAIIEAHLLPFLYGQEILDRLTKLTVEKALLGKTIADHNLKMFLLELQHNNLSEVLMECFADIQMNLKHSSLT